MLTPAQQLQQKHTEPADRQRLTTIEKNAFHLLRLIDQLMDLSKVEARAMPIREAPGRLDAFVRGLLESFQSQADQKQIELRFEPQLTGEYWFDEEKLERIIYNLVGNALKFTKSGGIVSVDLAKSANEAVCLTIADSGVGISPDNLRFIFDRFYQVRDDAASQQPGTGIGLALVKELVTIQQGTIEVDTTPGIGTTFTITLPYRPVVTSPVSPTSENAADLVSQSVDHKSRQPDWESPLLLVVEDNDELADFIRESLPSHYRQYRAVDGLDGYEKALELSPDLILSDVLMPRMDGYTLCSQLKSDVRTSHIPIVLLTAKSALESRLKGLSVGADDYILKPFHLTELQLRIQNLLDGRARLRDWVRQSLAQAEEAPSAPAPPDPFLSRIYQLLDEHLSDTTFGVNEVAREVGMSRASLYRKIKAVSDLPVNELMQQYRLKKATYYLRQGRGIAETAYIIGFESPGYFTKCFRDLYQLTPSEFIQTKNLNGLANG
ncbi:ATP-binding protein [Spirosoma sp. KNUC1025]|uniref:hybrid sensor histidine kinase/response regulator transcription factor n=1 Tax=Spirosoma sp. KNUC1025 TaxID=2894082 RepID=UPI003864BFCD|nr:response regulator [Spirosoma sp. KNUC1025]